MAYIHQGWVIAEPNNENNADDILKIGIKRGGVWDVLFVACKLCPCHHNLLQMASMPPFYQFRILMAFIIYNVS